MDFVDDCRESLEVLLPPLPRGSKSKLATDDSPLPDKLPLLPPVSPNIENNLLLLADSVFFLVLDPRCWVVRAGRDGRRLLIADVGNSTIQELVGTPEKLPWMTLAKRQQEQNTGVLLITSVQKWDPDNLDVKAICREFPRRSEQNHTNGNAIFATWDPKSWHVASLREVEVTKYPVRTALCQHSRS